MWLLPELYRQQCEWPWLIDGRKNNINKTREGEENPERERERERGGETEIRCSDNNTTKHNTTQRED